MTTFEIKVAATCTTTHRIVARGEAEAVAIATTRAVACCNKHLPVAEWDDFTASEVKEVVYS